MWANLVIGLDVTRTFVEFQGKRKNLYQLLREEAFGPFDGKRLSSIHVPEMEVVVASDGHEDEDGIEYYFGRRLTHWGDEDNEEGDGEGNEEEMKLTTMFPLELFRKHLEETTLAFKSMGIETQPQIYALTNEMGLEDEYPFQDYETVELLRKRIEFDLEYATNPFPDIIPDNELFVLEPAKEGDSPKRRFLKEKAEESYEYRFVMGRMGKGILSEEEKAQKLATLREYEEEFLKSPFWEGKLDEIISIRNELDLDEGLEDFIRASFDAYRKKGCWVALDNILRLEKNLLLEKIPLVENIVPEMRFWKEFRSRYREDSFFDSTSQDMDSEAMKRYLEFYNSVKTVSAEEEFKGKQEILKLYEPVAAYLDMASFYNQHILKQQLKMGYEFTSPDAGRFNYTKIYTQGLNKKFLELAQGWLLGSQQAKQAPPQETENVLGFLLKLELDSDIRVKVLSDLGLYHLLVGDFQQAVQDFDDALEQDPTTGKTYLLKAKALIQLKRFPEARDSLARAIRNGQGGEAIAWAMLGAVFYDLRQMDEAYACIFRAHQMEPQNPLVQRLIGDEYLGNYVPKQGLDPDRVALGAVANLQSASRAGVTGLDWPGFGEFKQLMARSFINQKFFHLLLFGIAALMFTGGLWDGSGLVVELVASYLGYTLPFLGAFIWQRNQLKEQAGPGGYVNGKPVDILQKAELGKLLDFMLWFLGFDVVNLLREIWSLDTGTFFFLIIIWLGAWFAYLAEKVDFLIYRALFRKTKEQ